MCCSTSVEPLIRVHVAVVDHRVAGQNSARILIVDDEASTRAALRAMLADGPDHVVAVDSGAGALRVLDSQPGPWVLLLDWVMPTLDGKSVCQIIRQRFDKASPYVVLMSARAGSAELADGLNAGADDFLLKPIDADLLHSRMVVARRHARAATRPSREVIQGLEEGTDAGSGELIVRDGDTVGRVLFDDHRVVWAHVAQDSEAFVANLCSHGVAEEQLEAAIEQARRRGDDFHRVVGTWGLLSRVRLEPVLRSWISRRLFAMLRFKDPRVLFVPMESAGAATVSFALEEVVSAADRARVSPIHRASDTHPATSKTSGWNTMLTSRETSEELESYLHEALKIDGAISAAVINRRSGVCEGRKGHALDPRRVWSTVQAFATMSTANEAVEDVLVTTRTRHHLLRALHTDPNRIGYVVLDRQRAALAKAREQLASVCRLRVAS